MGKFLVNVPVNRDNIMYNPIIRSCIDLRHMNYHYYVIDGIWYIEKLAGSLHIMDTEDVHFEVRAQYEKFFKEKYLSLD